MKIEMETRKLCGFWVSMPLYAWLGVCECYEYGQQLNERRHTKEKNTISMKQCTILFDIMVKSQNAQIQVSCYAYFNSGVFAFNGHFRNWLKFFLKIDYPRLLQMHPTNQLNKRFRISVTCSKNVLTRFDQFDQWKHQNHTTDNRHDFIFLINSLLMAHY